MVSFYDVNASRRKILVCYYLGLIFLALDMFLLKMRLWV